MPLIRKPADRAAVGGADTEPTLRGLKDPDPDKRWAAARRAATILGGDAALAAALPTETDPRVREAMFTSMARIGTPEMAEVVISLLRSDHANLRTGALDSLRIMVGRVQELLPRLLTDQDIDIRILSCDLARALDSAEANRLMCQVLDNEPEPNVCAAAVDVLVEVGGPGALPSLRACALRFHATPFLAFAIKVAIDRLGSQPSPPRA